MEEGKKQEEKALASRNVAVSVIGQAQAAQLKE